mmetsp:Transcript_9119/g.27344  ORF Transcript_9119/g.27344 Transcript_9119/m.27344 type:complete len:215 (+) Transcript_9119:191-835(+)
MAGGRRRAHAKVEKRKRIRGSLRGRGRGSQRRREAEEGKREGGGGLSFLGEASQVHLRGGGVRRPARSCRRDPVGDDRAKKSRRLESIRPFLVRESVFGAHFRPRLRRSLGRGRASEPRPVREVHSNAAGPGASSARGKLHLGGARRGDAPAPGAAMARRRGRPTVGHRRTGRLPRSALLRGDPVLRRRGRIIVGVGESVRLPLVSSRVPLARS